MTNLRMLSSGAFDPDTVNAVTTAYEHACAALDLIDRTDPLKETIAKKIIEHAKSGERDAVRLCEAILKEFADQSLIVAPASSARTIASLERAPDQSKPVAGVKSGSVRGSG